MEYVYLVLVIGFGTGNDVELKTYEYRQPDMAACVKQRTELRSQNTAASGYTTYDAACISTTSNHEK